MKETLFLSKNYCSSRRKNSKCASRAGAWASDLRKRNSSGGAWGRVQPVLPEIFCWVACRALIYFPTIFAGKKGFWLTVFSSRSRWNLCTALNFSCWLWFKSFQCRGGIIGVTQPRHVAVLATAKRVAFELGFSLGKEVGFQVRHDRRIGDNCSIKFMTDGILLRELQNDFLLRRYSILILDEAHERSLNTDILIGMLSRIVRERQREYEEQQKKVLSGQTVSPEERVYPLKLVLMSATLRVEDFISGQKNLRDPPPVMEVPTRLYPVTVHFSKRTEMVDYVGKTYKKILSIHKRLPPGGILVFVTEQREVEYLCQKLRKASKEIVERASKLDNQTSLVLKGIPSRKMLSRR
ncbi:PREDICTED: ATP-dependent RNA helicase DEAH13-like [Nicotiana attenuata]|uniref:ATP-dependent RNA helicase DEAH13-like n=1 Tax=Nicotiana attenuata TaxID=49451 RepID=UPI000905BA91|nr:PREDICTED: ATP-dependent RNA helicase DEAH13-like [Nicotiana attenuata]